MNDDSGLSTYLAILVAVMLLVGALVLSRRQTGAGGPATATGPEPAAPPTAGSGAADRRRRVVGLVRCALLAVLAVVLAAWQWQSPDSLLPFWLLLATGGAFALLARRAVGTSSWERGLPAGRTHRDGQRAPWLPV